VSDPEVDEMATCHDCERAGRGAGLMVNMIHPQINIWTHHCTVCGAYYATVTEDMLRPRETFIPGFDDA
jgi:hypothetical protein